MIPEVDAFVINHNGSGLLQDCLSALRDQRGVRLRLHVFDNASTDGSADIRVPVTPDTLVHSDANLGYGPALQKLLEATRGGADWIAAVTPDIQPEPEALRRMWEEGCADPRIGWVAGLTRLPGGRIESAGLSYSRGGLARLRTSPTAGADLLAPNGGFLLARRAMLEEIGFEPSLFLYYEEVALALRARAAGWRVALATAAAARHRPSSITGRDPAVKAYHLARSRWVVLLDLWPAAWWRRNAASLVSAEALSLGRNLLAGHLGPALAGRRDAWRGRKQRGRRAVPSAPAIPWNGWV